MKNRFFAPRGDGPGAFFKVTIKKYYKSPLSSLDKKKLGDTISLFNNVL
jgi:hypothetical protein